jgi:redox-sensitive bicupin YhaK (pirin superfamily)
LIQDEFTVNGEELRPGDRAAISAEEQVKLAAAKDALFLLFDLN